LKKIDKINVDNLKEAIKIVEERHKLLKTKNRLF